jgi:uncharacterized repeat protein (TIGR03803 family)
MEGSIAMKYPDSINVCKAAEIRRGFPATTSSFARTTSLAMCLAATISLPAQTFKTLATFTLGNGAPYFVTLAQGIDGSLYGTTNGGGSNGMGTIFRVTPAGTVSTVVNFDGINGQSSSAGLLLAEGGAFYGTTYLGGAKGDGIVFDLAHDTALTVLDSFAGANGNGPSSVLIQGLDGDFYGTTTNGGANQNSQCVNVGLPGCGTIFKMSRAGSLTTLYSFCAQTNCADGTLPYAGLLQGSDGNFYGTTAYGGSHQSEICFYGGTDATTCGTVFKITPSGKLTTLYEFCAQSNCTDGSIPYGGLIQAADGTLYGTTAGGGASNLGTVFEINTKGELTTLHSFSESDGAHPWSGLMQATDGNFYGMTAYGGAGNFGTIFKMARGGELTSLHSFGYEIDGAYPFGGLMQDTNGNLYGVTSLGGDHGGGFGTVFVLGVGLGPFIKTVPVAGGVGAEITILGTNLAQVTGVSFNGSAAAFKAISNTALTATVPAGATSGPVDVVTLSSTLSSNMPFQVLP